MTEKELREKFPGLYKDENDNSIEEEATEATNFPIKRPKATKLSRKEEATPPKPDIEDVESTEINEPPEIPIPKKKKAKKYCLNSYLLITLIYFVCLYLIFLILNNFVLPEIVHSRPMVSVPDVVGMTSEQAREKLLMNKIDFEITGAQYSDEHKPDIVLKQHPSPGYMVKEMRPVYLTVSRGPKMVQVPNITGFQYRKAEIQLMNTNLVFGKKDSVHSEEYPAGTIISQIPKAFKDAKIGSKVNITLSVGSENKVVVPDLIGYALESIFRYIEENGLHLGNVVYEESALYDSRTIIRQVPAAGDTVMQGSSVNITVAR